MHNTHREIAKTLDLENTADSKSKKIWLTLIIILGISAVVGIYFKYTYTASKIEYITKEVKRDTLTIMVSATGNLEPLNKVDVGTEISGTIEEIFVDYNAPVKIGQTLAKLDAMKLQLKVKNSKAVLSAAKANLASANAALDDANKSWERYRKVYISTSGRLPSQNEMDKSTAAYKKSLAGRQSAIAQIEQARATLESDEDNLKKTVITSPINGIVLVKNIEEGQTVAASLQTPILFKLAEDLTQMKVIVSIDEADVGRVTEEQNATFSVDAYPDRLFQGKITQVRLNSMIVNGVVTYEAVMQVQNPKMLLRPGMTVTADIITKVVQNATLVPNAALRLVPPEKVMANEKKSERMIDKLMPSPPKKEMKAKITDKKSKPSVWILKEDRPVQVFVETGDSDGTLTVITGENLKPGTKVIVDIEEE